MTYTVEAAGPVAPAERALAPDLARGAMLWFIAVANASGVAFGGVGLDPAPATALERLLNLFMTTAVHARAYPVFAVMFGYGLVQLARRQQASGATPKRVRDILLRRNAWLIVFGFVHAALLYYGDFLGAYGLIGIAATLLLLPRGDRFHNAVLWLWGAVLVEILVLSSIGAVRILHSTNVPAPIPAQPVDSLMAATYFASLLARLREWPLHTVTVLPAIFISWLGIWAARRRVLEDASKHRRLLRLTAIIGLSIAWLGGLPLALVSAGLLRVDAAAVDMLFYVHQVSGMFGGPGYVAMAGLAALSFSRAQVAPIAALGQRSLSGYLFQSVAWLAMGLRYSMLTALTIGTLVWLISLAAAHEFERRSHPGFPERLLRRLTY